MNSFINYFIKEKISISAIEKELNRMLNENPSIEIENLIDIIENDKNNIYRIQVNLKNYIENHADELKNIILNKIEEEL